MSHASVLVVTDEPSEESIQYQLEPFDENDHWFADGSRWDWYQIGGRYRGRLHGKDQARVADLDPVVLLAERRARYAAWWEEASGEDTIGRSLIYGIEAEMTREQYITKAHPLDCYAFLRDRRWNEQQRLGWFGVNAATECEIDGKKPSKCLYVDPETGARIICWYEDSETWGSRFWDRFIRPLRPEQWVTVVDYHV